MSKKWQRIVRPATEEERERHAEIREHVTKEFPPLDPPRRAAVSGGIGARIRAARQAQGLTRFALAERAGLSVSSTIRDIEQGRDAQLSDVGAIAAALGMEIALVQAGQDGEQGGSQP